MMIGCGQRGPLYLPKPLPQKTSEDISLKK
ncbi:LPS translocon maturation chaperone LptM [Legionella adelaidensis]